MLVKRELMPPFHRFDYSVGRSSQVLAQFCQEFYDGDGKIRQQFKGRGFWGADFDDSWVFVVTRIVVADENRRRGVGTDLFRTVLGRVLQWAAEEAPEPRSVFTVSDPEVMRQEAEAQGFRSSADFGRFYRESLSRAESFWRSLGFDKIGALLWFGWMRRPGEGRSTLQAGGEPTDVDSDLDQLFGTG
ncbi:Uu.00g103180.m01.CDS01 [Anthostomella pinea]|uniref:Uu.00g103180.m01.CDS01 n=1 Tax=Anthostomella pinea TaxID=933095 RepID=A0AAI8YFQ1_9PEZI|nr:Uu.00g103180.m01.CDS01 [Anthostomella pinea]